MFSNKKYALLVYSCLLIGTIFIIGYNSQKNRFINQESNQTDFLTPTIAPDKKYLYIIEKYYLQNPSFPQINWEYSAETLKDYTVYFIQEATASGNVHCLRKNHPLISLDINSGKESVIDELGYECSQSPYSTRSMGGSPVIFLKSDMKTIFYEKISRPTKESIVNEYFSFDIASKSVVQITKEAFDKEKGLSLENIAPIASGECNGKRVGNEIIFCDREDKILFTETQLTTFIKPHDNRSERANIIAILKNN